MLRDRRAGDREVLDTADPFLEDAAGPAWPFPLAALVYSIVSRTAPQEAG